jgi:hypothetical protein
MLDSFSFRQWRSVMSQATQPTVSLHDQVLGHWIVAISALLALLAAIAVALVLAIDGGSSGTKASVAEQQPALRSDGGLEESAVAASVATPTSTGPDESRLGHAALMGQAAPTPARPDESRVAAAIAGD